MPVIIDGTNGITTPAESVTGTGVWSVGGTQIYKDASGNVGIGTSSPNFNGATGTVCHINNAASSAWTINHYTNGSTGSGTADGFVVGTIGVDSYVFNYEAGPIIFGTSTTEQMRIDPSGNVGIGTSSPNPAYRLDVSGLARFTAGSVVTGGNAFQLVEITGNNSWYFNNNANNLTFTYNASERMRIDGNGNLCLGRSSVGTGDRFVVQTISGGTIMLGYNSSAGLTYVIYENGDVRNSNNSYGAISDAKLKENVTDATPKLNEINQVRVVNFNLIGDTKKQIGVIAQELEQVFPGLVDETTDRDSEGNDLGTTTKSVKYSVFVPMLIKAIQEQQVMITELKAIIDTQADRIAALEAK